MYLQFYYMDDCTFMKTTNQALGTMTMFAYSIMHFKALEEVCRLKAVHISSVSQEFHRHIFTSYNWLRKVADVLSILWPNTQSMAIRCGACIVCFWMPFWGAKPTTPTKN
jgi:hypothetical protein